MDFTVGSLFSGIGGADLGLQRAGMRISWQVEIDPDCQRVLEAGWPGLERHGDIRQFQPNETHQVDLLCGGFPCIDISRMGARGGFDGAHTGLWR